MSFGSGYYSLAISLAFVLRAAAQDSNDSSDNIGGRVIAGVLVGVAVLTLLLTFVTILRRRRRLRAMAVLPPPGGAVTGGVAAFGPHPLPDPAPRWNSPGGNQQSAFAAPPPPYHQKEGLGEETLARGDDTAPPADEYAQSPQSTLAAPPPAHINDNENPFRETVTQ